MPGKVWPSQAVTSLFNVRKIICKHTCLSAGMCSCLYACPHPCLPACVRSCLPGGHHSCMPFRKRVCKAGKVPAELRCAARGTGTVLQTEFLQCCRLEPVACMPWALCEAASGAIAAQLAGRCGWPEPGLYGLARARARAIRRPGQSGRTCSKPGSTGGLQAWLAGWPLGYLSFMSPELVVYLSRGRKSRSRWAESGLLTLSWS